MRRWAASATVYAAAEMFGARIEGRPPTKERIVPVAVLGATGDALCLRSFHYTVDRCLPHSLLRMLAEQMLYTHRCPTPPTYRLPHKDFGILKILSDCMYETALSGPWHPTPATPSSRFQCATCTFPARLSCGAHGDPHSCRRVKRFQEISRDFIVDLCSGFSATKRAVPVHTVYALAKLHTSLGHPPRLQFNISGAMY